MKSLVQFNATPLNYSKIKSEKSKTGEFIKITFLVEKPDDTKGTYYGDKNLDVLEVFDTYTSEYDELLDTAVTSVRLSGIFSNFKFTLTGYDNIKKGK